MEITFEDNGSPLKKSKNRHGETCEEQLRRMCKNIADSITSPNPKFIGPEDEEPRQETAHDWMEGVYNIEWITHQDKTYKSARLMVAGGGPSIWVNLQRNVVQGYWWGDYCEHRFSDQIGLDEYLQEIFDC